MIDLTKPHCFYIPVGAFVKDKGYIPSIVIKGESGHYPMMGRGSCAEPWYWGMTYKEACEICDNTNEKQGISKKEADQIVASSMGASTKTKTGGD